MENLQPHVVPRLTTPISPVLKAQLKIAAVKRNMHLQALVREILQRWHDENEKEAVT